jgi:drug/metabolite transporter (DMT)-like permease
VKTKQVLGILLIVAGLISLIWGGVSWTREETVLDLGPIEATRRERETIPVPPIVGGLLLVGGVLLLVWRPRRV